MVLAPVPSPLYVPIQTDLLVLQSEPAIAVYVTKSPLTLALAVLDRVKPSGSIVTPVEFAAAPADATVDPDISLVFIRPAAAVEILCFKMMNCGWNPKPEILLLAPVPM
jgi:hypothetical protein